MTDSITNRVGDEMRVTNNAIIDRWIHLTFHPCQPSAWYDTSGNYDDSRMTRIGLTFTAPSGNAYVDRVWYTHNSMPIISFSFDDAWKEAWDTYGAVLRKYGLSGVWGFNPGMSIPSNFMSLADLREAHDCGHEIINHTWNHRALSYNSAASCEDQALAGQDFLVSNGFTDGARFLLLCYTGQMSTEGFDALRNHMYFPSTIQRINPLPELPYPYLFRYAPASVAAWQTAVDAVCSRGGWLIYYTHTPSMAGSPTVEDFEAMVQYVISKKK
ncbi:polysaccharide deacetylase family protein [Methanosarcina horonobensis]|uniref:polysaccharide deacetylase family protein n=1 Tax=Methanosarcina horonobensis TaxID=418008 RepID=UPI000AF30E0D|nr:polysaccharide deacetylase family protein [Methanosarcina horonobensis]